MRYSILSLIAGLCLAIFFVTGCDGGLRLTAPPINTGEVTIIDNGDGQLISNEPVVLTWDFVPNIDHFKVEYSTDGGRIWTPIGETTQATCWDWKIPAGTSTEAFIVRVDGYSNQSSAPQSRAFSPMLSVVPFGTLHHITIIVHSTVAVNETFSVSADGYDMYNNLVPLDNTTSYAWAWDFGDGNTSSAATPTHVYSIAGIYNITLTLVLIDPIIGNMYSDSVEVRVS